MNYKIINSGSDGNCTILEEIIAIDMGVSYKAISSYVNKLQLVLLTHIHSDHFNKSTIKKLAKERPTLRFGCCKWLVEFLIECGINKRNIDVYRFEEGIHYNDNLSIEVFELFHDVPNCGYKVFINEKKIIYATDTNSLGNTEAKDYDLYLIEGNYENKDELRNRSENDYYYERVIDTHLSKEYTTQWLLKNMGDNSEFKFMHEHKEHTKKEG
ncbi:MAG: hypothetical protein IKQ33_01625 [Clostridia bacterium]|nr:hypothetical protein [Clostridia bacterium]